MKRADVAQEDEDMLFIDDCDAALIGRGERCGQVPVAVYSYRKLVRCFMRMGMDEEEAEEWISFNIAGAWVGPHTPVILYRPTPQ
jgi:hypothetical protein